MKTQEKVFNVDVSPEMQLYKILQKLSYDMENALAEFVDNSVQSFIEHADESSSGNILEVLIEIDSKSKRIIISDNAFGINRDNFQRAIRIGHKNGFSHQQDSLSVYGIGLKSSAIWFSDVWSIETSALGHNEKLKASFNLNELLRSGEQTIPVESLPEQSGAHYTRIIISDITRNLNEEYFRDTALPFLRETFFKFPFLQVKIIFDGLVLQNNNEIVNNPEPLISPKADKKGNISGKNFTWKKFIELDYAGRKVRGFFTIMNKGSYKQPGIRLLRNNRVIAGTAGKRNIPQDLYQTSNKYAAQRLYGELHLDEFPVNFMKTGFDESLTGLYRLLNSELRGNDVEPDFISQVENYRAKNKQRPPTDQQETAENSNIATPATHPVSPNLPSGNKEKPIEEIPVQEETMPEHIRFSNELDKALGKLKSTKIQRFYKSMCRISLTKDALLAYVCAWAFFESLKNHLSSNPNQEFTAYFNQHVSKFYPGRDDKKPYTQALAEILSKGNLCKHNDKYEAINAQQLVADFKLLEDLLRNILKVDNDNNRL